MIFSIFLPLDLSKLFPRLVLNAKNTVLPKVSMQTLIYNISKFINNFKKPYGESCFIMNIF